MRKISGFLTMFVLLVSVFPQSAARADVAPPESPPGTNPVPGNESTQVRMVAETVTLTISADPADAHNAIAKTHAVFTMHNLGAQEEKMQARFPLSFFNGNSDGFGNFPEIKSIAVKINGAIMPTRREMQPFFDTEMSYRETAEIPWAVFDVVFPPEQDVNIEVDYVANGYGYYPYVTFKYILETGAGWKDNIGSAEIIVRLPYEVSEQNMDIVGQAGYGGATPGGIVNGNEIRWHYENFEPSSQDNILVSIVTPSLWQKTLTEKENVQRNPKDGEAWGRLGKAYKEVVRMPKGYLRDDPAAEELFRLSKEAYQTCLSLLPKDSLWHYGYADLLWSKYLFQIYWTGKPDTENFLTTTLTELQTALVLDPNNQQAKDLLQEISWAVPDAVQGDGNNYALLGLTATPIPPTPYGGYPTDIPTDTPQPTPEPSATARMELIPTPAPTKQPTAQNPLCGTASLLPALAIGIWISPRKRD